MSEPIANPETKSKKNKNKNKNKNKESEAGANPASGLLSSLSALGSLGNLDIFSKFNEMLNLDKEVNFDKFNTYQESIKQEIQSIRGILHDISAGKLDNFPLEDKKNENQFPKGSLGDKKAKLLAELKDKIDFLKERSAKAETYVKEFPNDTKLAEIVNTVKECLQDDVNRNTTLYEMIESC